MITLVLPRQVAGRDLADELINQLGSLGGQTVLVDARRTTHATGSFGAQIVKRVLMTEQAERLTIVAGPSRLVQSIQKTGEVLGVTGQLELVSELPASV
jgi:FlaA1/EpsC-like NDP-sugar epimerase